MSQGTELTRLADKLNNTVRDDLKRRMREKMLGQMGNTVDEVLEEFFRDFIVEIDSETLAIKVSHKTHKW